MKKSIEEKNRNIDLMCQELAKQLKLAVSFSHDLQLHERCTTNAMTTGYDTYEDSGKRTLTIRYEL